MSKRNLYFVKQKLIGVLLLVLTAVAVVGTGEATVCLMTVPLGLFLIFTKRMCIIDNYYYEEKERRRL